MRDDVRDVKTYQVNPGWGKRKRVSVADASYKRQQEKNARRLQRLKTNKQNMADISWG